MMGNLSMQKNDHNDKTKIKINGFVMRKSARVSICTSCAKISGCLCNSDCVSTSAEYWLKIKSKYRFKIMGKYRLILYIKRQHRDIIHKEY